MPLSHPRAEPHTETLTWANTGDEPVTVAVGAALENRDGEPVDEVSVEPAELVIAPGAAGSAALRVDGQDLAPACTPGR